MKTLKQWEKSGLDLEDFIHPGDWISEDLYNYIGEIVWKMEYCFTVPAIILRMIDIYILVFFRSLSSNYHN